MNNKKIIKYIKNISLIIIILVILFSLFSLAKVIRIQRDNNVFEQKSNGLSQDVEMKTDYFTYVYKDGSLSKELGDSNKDYGF